MATLQSQSDRLLVVRESGAPLPNLDEARFKFGSTQSNPREQLHENLTVISQFSDEGEADFAERVMARVTRDLEQGVVFRGVVVAVNHEAQRAEAEARTRLVHSLAAMLALRPNGSLQLQATVNAREDERMHLLDLAESTARGAPHLDVNLAFPAVSPERRRRTTGKITGLRLSV